MEACSFCSKLTPSAVASTSGRSPSQSNSKPRKTWKLEQAKGFFGRWIPKGFALPSAAGPLFSSKERPKGLASAEVDWTALPAWVVKGIVEKIIPPNPCGEGHYLDPRTNSCVYMCRPGYVYDPETKSCVLALECKEGYIQKDNACVPDTSCGKGYAFDETVEACTPVQGSIMPERSIADQAVAWITQRLVAGDDSCPVGFYLDQNTNSCVPLCAPGYLYDRQLKKCIPTQGGSSDHVVQKQSLYLRKDQ